MFKFQNQVKLKMYEDQNFKMTLHFFLFFDQTLPIDKRHGEI